MTGKIEHSILPTHIKTVLLGQNISTFEQLRKYTYDEVMEFKNLGKKGIQILEDHMEFSLTRRPERPVQPNWVKVAEHYRALAWPLLLEDDPIGQFNAKVKAYNAWLAQRYGEKS